MSIGRWMKKEGVKFSLGDQGVRAARSHTGFNCKRKQIIWETGLGFGSVLQLPALNCVSWGAGVVSAEGGFKNNQGTSWRTGFQAIHVSEFTPFPQLSKMSVAVSISQVRKLKLSKASRFILGPTAPCGQARVETKSVGTQKDVLFTSLLLCLTWCKKVHVWKEGGWLKRDLCIYHLGTEDILAKPDLPAQVRSLGLRAVWGQRGPASCLLAPPLTAQASGHPACLSLPSWLTGTGTNLWVPSVP